MAETEIKSINGKPIADTTARQDKADKAGWSANKYIGTDENGNLVEKDPPQPGITQENDPTVPDWAKQPKKPSYTADEVGALPASTKIPAKTSDITNDSGFITNVVTDLVNYYTKSQTYTQAEVNALVSAIPKFAIAVVSALPTSGISTTTVYLVKSGTGGDLYTEYIYVNGAWEILGSQRVDLTGYATEAWVNTKIADFLTADKLTAAIITAALGYAPAKQTDVDDLSGAIVDLKTDVEQSVKTVNGTAPDDNGNVDVIANIEPPKIVSSVDEMTDTDKHYVLQSTGTIWAYRTTTTESDTVFVPNFTNLIKFDTNGNPTNVVLNQRYSGSAGAAAGYMTSETGSFAITDTYDISGTPTIYINQKPSGQTRFAFFMEDGTTLHSNGVITISATAWANGENGEFMGVPTTSIDAPKMKFSANMASDALTADSIKDLIVTIDEPITYTEQKTDDEIVGEWYDTGISYAPTFKTDLIGVLGEDNVIYLSDNLPSGTYTLKYGDDNYATVGTISK